MTVSYKEFVDAAESAARAGGAVVMEYFGRCAAREKAPKDLVTDADLASQEAIRQYLLSRFPDHGFLGEESGAATAGESGSRWIVDPLDGTTNFVHRVPHFCVSVALEHQGELLAGAIYHPVHNECYRAARGEGAWLDGQRLQVSEVERLPQALCAASFGARTQRHSLELKRFIEVLLAAQSIHRGGSAALNLAYVAAGRFDAYWSESTHIWDIAAGVLLVQEAGGVVASLYGGAFRTDNPHFLAAATEPLHRELQILFADL